MPSSNLDCFGFTEEQKNKIIATLKSFPHIERVILFGSRAMGNYRPGSDVDLAIICNNATCKVSSIKGRLNDETSVAFEFDLVDYAKITNDELKQHIDQHGIQLMP